MLISHNVTDTQGTLKMEMNQPSSRIHPMMAGAAASVMLVSLVGVAAMTGILPNSHSSAVVAMGPRTQPTIIAAAPAPAPTPTVNPPVVTAPVNVKEVVEHKTVVHHQYVERTAPARNRPIRLAVQEASSQYYPAPAYQQPAPTYQTAPAYQPTSTYQPAPTYQPTSTYQQQASNSPVGMGLGAVVGGLIGSQVGGGTGKTLATIAGAIGGGYLGNEVAKRNP